MSAIQSFVKRYAIGKGIVSGYVSVFLSLLALGGLMCFYFPKNLPPLSLERYIQPNQ
jgi:hypothetical protein